MERRAIRKSQKLYKAIDDSKLFVYVYTHSHNCGNTFNSSAKHHFSFVSHVPLSAPVEAPARSRMNVVFRVRGDSAAELEDLFVKEAQARGLEQLRGHRYVGSTQISVAVCVCRAHVKSACVRCLSRVRAAPCLIAIQICGRSSRVSLQRRAGRSRRRIDFLYGSIRRKAHQINSDER